MTSHDGSEQQHNKRTQPIHCCISHRFSTTASQNPNKIAVIHAESASPSVKSLRDGDRFFTYAELISAVDSLTSQLRRFNLNSPSSELRPRIIGLYMVPSVEYVVSVLSVLRSGEAFLPLDPSWPKQRLLSVVASADVDLIVASTTPFGYESDSDWLEKCSNRSFLRFSMVGGESVTLSEGGECECECEGEKERLFCYVMYTSGSTGKPKGVCGTERGLWNRLRWMQELYPLKGEEVLLFKTAVSFVDHLQEFLSAILTGCTLVIPRFDQLKQNVYSIVDYLEAYSINRLTAVPSLMRVILPALQGRDYQQHLTSLNLLVLSGEVLPVSLWDLLSKRLPTTSILNLYGSTEVSGDCTYFDCKRLPMIMETETLTSVPIGIPIAGCDVLLVSDDDDAVDEGEIFVAGLCNSSGYYCDSTFIPLETVKLPPGSVSSISERESGPYFQTGDFAKQLHSGDLVFMGRKDRTIKLNGQRIALEEVEHTLVGHPDVTDAAVVFHNVEGELMRLVAFIILKEGQPDDMFRSSIKSWMVDKLPLAMIPGHIVIMKSFPVSTSGKVNYALLADSVFLLKHIQDELGQTGRSNLLQVIKKAFNRVLMAEELSDDDDFFMIGGNSIAAAHLANNIGVDMRMIYSFPTPFKLCMALLERKGPFSMKAKVEPESEIIQKRGKDMFQVLYDTPSAVNLKLLKPLSRMNDDKAVIPKRLKVDSSVNVASGSTSPADGYPWISVQDFSSCSFSRCNRVVYGGSSRDYEATGSVVVLNNRKVHLEGLWKVDMGSCVDASPLIVCNGQDIYVFIGSHSHKFMCVNGRSGSIRWELQLEGRVECSAAILGDFTQVVVGCYKGKIYFLDSLNGNICWTFQTSGEVKSQPVIDGQRQLIWCGSYDHNLYALDYKNHCCVYQLSCGGSVCGSPAIDEMNSILYVASTGGKMTALSLMALPCSVTWVHELEVPVFGSLAINSQNGNIICCLVDGHVLAFNTSGSIIWKECRVLFTTLNSFVLIKQYRTAGPVFAGACISSALPLQVLVCSRDGSIYSLELETGGLLWKYNVEDPITSSAYVDEHLSLVSGQSNFPDSRVVCVCSSSGSVTVLQVNLDASKGAIAMNCEIEEFARLELAGDVFSSPVMIGGRIFVGCRDDFVRCIALSPRSLQE